MPGLFKEAFSRRLQHEGWGLASGRTEANRHLSLSLRYFLLDLADGMWVVKVEFEAAAIQNGKVLATQIINGEAERYRLMGRQQASEVAGELFTDVVNKLDLGMLFEKAVRSRNS